MFHLHTSTLKRYPDGSFVLRPSVRGDYGSSFILYAGKNYIEVKDLTLLTPIGCMWSV